MSSKWKSLPGGTRGAAWVEKNLARIAGIFSFHYQTLFQGGGFSLNLLNL
jgi:hypothetical protein